MPKQFFASLISPFSSKKLQKISDYFVKVFRVCCILCGSLCFLCGSLCDTHNSTEREANSPDKLE
jgi:hypothetical protein